MGIIVFFGIPTCRACDPPHVRIGLAEARLPYTAFLKPDEGHAIAYLILIFPVRTDDRSYECIIAHADVLFQWVFSQTAPDNSDGFRIKKFIKSTLLSFQRPCFYDIINDMKRRHYRIHYTDHAKPLRRVKHRQIRWGSIALMLLAIVLLAVVVYAVFVWFRMDGSGNFFAELLRPFTGQ